MNKPCPTCGGKKIVLTDCPYCRDSDSFEHDDLAGKTCIGCQDRGFLEHVCPTCGG